MKEFIANIKEKLTEVAELKFIDENTGQLDYYSPNFPVKFPCALIDISNADYSDIGKDRNAVPQNRQMALVTATINIANLKLTNSSSNAPVNQKANALSIQDIIESVHQKMHGFRPSENSTALIRKSRLRIQRDDGIQEYQIRYTAELNNV